MEPTRQTVRAIMSPRRAAHLARWADKTNVKILLLVGAALLGPVGVGVAYADSDGYYCVGPGYLAYQFGMAPLPVTPHRLHVLSLGTAPGIPEPATLELPQFQVHGLRCGDGWIEVASFTAIYRVTLDDSIRPIRYDVRPFATGQKVPPEFYPQRNLGMLSPARAHGKFERVSLGGRDGGGHVFLEMAGYDVPNERCRVELKTRVVETDRNGREIRDRVIYQAREHRECGGVPGGHVSSRPTRRAADGGECNDERRRG